MYKCALLKGETTRRFFEYQITGAAEALRKTLGNVPTEGMPLEHFNNEQVKEAFQALRSLAVSGHINADQTGLGKTIHTLLALCFLTKFAPEDTL